MKTILFIDNKALRFIVTSLVLSIIFIKTAYADIGVINVHQITHNSITISRTINTNSYQPAGGEDNKICWKKDSNTFGIICHVNSDTTDDNSFTITELEPNTTYKIKLKCYCRKKTVFNNFAFLRWRTVTTITVKTAPEPSPSTPYSSLSVFDITKHTAKTRLTHDNMLDFNWVGVCYRKKWQVNFTTFVNGCRNTSMWFNNPYWGGAGFRFGELNVAPYWVDANNSVLVPLDHWQNKTLEDCTRYKIMAIALDDEFEWVTDIGAMTEIKTLGKCSGFLFFKMSNTIVHDYEEVFEQYARSIDVFYRKSLFDVLVEYDESLDETRELLMRDEQEDIRQTSVLLTYLIETESHLYDHWQNSREIRENRMSLENYIEDHYPRLFRGLIKEQQD